uniref:Peptidase A1 domain-containing protein n=2 Tax=Meloidogyne TaxID=189290 RepID=A0A915MX97_MELJA
MVGPISLYSFGTVSHFSETRYQSEREVISGDSDVSVGIGSVTLGSENEKDCAAGSYKHAKLSGNEWATDLNLIKIGNDKINVGNEMIKAKKTQNIPKLRIVDSALYMYAPKEQLDKIAIGLGVLNISKNVSDFYLLPLEKCQQEKTMPNVVLNVGDLQNKKINVVLKPKQYMELYEEEHGDKAITETCRLLFLPNEGMKGFDNNDWNMGELFMLNRCVSLNFDEGTIGFADKINNLEDKLEEIEDAIDNI